MGRLSNEIESFEREAREKYNSALCRLQDENPAEWFLRILNKSILPPLSSIGFDNHFTLALFQIALHSWERMGPAVDECLWIHPSLTRDIEEIRKSVLWKADKKIKTQMTLANMSSQEIYDHINRSMSPENLTSLLDDISTSWIILPRAHSLLRESDGCCLISYLKYLKIEKSPDFRRLIARIIIEFLANYSLKYASAIQPKKAVAEVIFYGYSAMFWKNLEHPPDGCEELAIYKNFLGWGKAFQKRTNSITKDMTETIKKMVVMEEILFPTGYGHPITDYKEMESDRYLITLRHGTRGLETICKFFGVAGNTLKHRSRNRFIVPSRSKALIRLIGEIEKGHENETQKTKEMISIFMERLKYVYSTFPSHAESLERLAFSGPRFVSIINEFGNHFSRKGDRQRDK